MQSCASARVPRKKQKVFAVRKKFRIAMGGLTFFSVEFGDRAGRSTCSGHRVNATERCRRKKDHSLRVPRSAPSFDCVCEGEDRPASSINFFQFAIGEEGDRLTVVRPKRPTRILCARKRLGDASIELAHPDGLRLLAFADD